MRTFDPWVGSSYWTQGLLGARVLVLGESHYGEVDAEYRACTIEVVREWGQERRLRFFTLTQKLILGLGPGWVSPDERSEFWERVAFYNFVQSFPGPEPRYRPTDAMWQAANKPFLATLSELSPHLIVVLGFELHRHMPAVPENIVVCAVQHPSSRGFKIREWQTVIATGFNSLAHNITQQGAAADVISAASRRQFHG